MKRLALTLAMLCATAAWADAFGPELLSPYGPPDQAPPQPLQPYPPSSPRLPVPPQQPGQQPYYYPPPYYPYPPNYYYPPPYYYYPQQYPQQYYYPPPVAAPALPRRLVDPGRRMIKLDVGYAYRYAFRDSINALALELMLGTERARSAGGGKLGIELGRTSAGLQFQAVELGGGFDWRLGKRVRLGFSPTVTFLIFERATRANSDLWTIGLGLRTDLTVDLWQRRQGGALYAGARIGYDFVPAADEHHGFAARLRLGWRF
jgi:spore coat protein T